METALELTVTAQLHKDNLIERQAHQVEGFGHRRSARILSVGHLEGGGGGGIGGGRIAKEGRGAERERRNE